MICPYCGHENTPGADQCESCLEPLTPVEPAAAASEPVLLERPVRTLRPRAPISVTPQATVREVLQTLAGQRIGCVLVKDGEQLVGIFSERDVLLKISDNPDEHLDRPVQDYMTPNPETVGMDDRLAFALHKMDVGDYRHLPVMKGDRAVGIVSVRDILQLIVRQISTG